MARNWPLLQCLADFTTGPPSIPTAASADLLAAGSGVALRSFSTSRGRQYELGTVQAGTLQLGVDDPAEKLNPVNTGSAWNSGANQLLPYRGVQLAAWWNSATKDTTGNFINATNDVPASTIQFDPSFETSTGGFFGSAGAPSLATSTTQHFAGAKALQVTYTATADTVTLALSLCPKQQYTLSLYVFVAAGHTVTATWSDYPWTVPATIGTATSSVTAAWQRLTMTATPQTPYPHLDIKVASGTFSTIVYVDALQMELGSSASAFTTAGPTFFPVYTGYIERYPQEWTDQGMRGVRPLSAVDALSVLSRTVISQSYAATVLADAPALYIPYTDDGFPQAVQRLTGGQPAVPYQQLGSQSPSISFGGDSFPDGSKVVSLSQQNVDPVTVATDNTQVTYLGTRQGALSIRPQSFCFEVWLKHSAGQVYGGAAAMQPGESTVGETTGPTKGLHALASNFGKMSWSYDDPAGGTSAAWNYRQADGTLFFPDGAWHHLVIAMTGSNNISPYLDTFANVVRTMTGTISAAVQLDNFYIAPTTYFGDPLSQAAVAHWAAYQSPLSPTQILNHYQRGIGYIGEMSGVRALRLLTQYWSSNVVTDTGESSMAPDFSYNGRSMLDVLQEIADTEAGLVWADSAGMMHQDSRETRYVAATSATSQFTFGENAAGGELPYDSLSYDYDPTYVYSQANFTAGGSGTQLAPVINATSQTAYGQRILSKTLQMRYDWDVNQAAQFYVQRYAKPAGAPGTGTAPRISGMTIDPAANPNLWTAVLTLDIGYRVTVKRRTAAGVTISGDYYIEQVNHHNDGDDGKWTVEYQLSPVFVSQPWILGDVVKGVLGSTTVCVY